MINTKEELISLLKSYDEKISSLETKLEEATAKPEPETTPTPEPETEPKTDETPEPEEEKDLDEIEKLIQGGI